MRRKGEKREDDEKEAKDVWKQVINKQSLRSRNNPPAIEFETARRIRIRLRGPAGEEERGGERETMRMPTRVLRKSARETTTRNQGESARRANELTERASERASKRYREGRRVAESLKRVS